VAALWQMTCDLRHPMSLRHPVLRLHRCERPSTPNGAFIIRSTNLEWLSFPSKMGSKEPEYQLTYCGKKHQYTKLLLDLLNCSNCFVLLSHLLVGGLRGTNELHAARGFRWSISGSVLSKTDIFPKKQGRKREISNKSARGWSLREANV